MATVDLARIVGSGPALCAALLAKLYALPRPSGRPLVTLSRIANCSRFTADASVAGCFRGARKAVVVAR